MSILLQPASGTEAMRHYEDTISTGVRLQLLKKYLGPKDYSKTAQLGSGEGHGMGIVPRDDGIPRSQWTRLAEDDLVLFYARRGFYYFATVLLTFHSKELAESLWGTDDKGKTWEYIYILKEGKEIAIRYDPTILGYTKQHVVYGAQLLTPEQSNALLAYIGKEGVKLVDEDRIEPNPAEEDAFSAKINKVKTPEEAAEELKRLSQLMKLDPVEERIKKAKTLVRNPAFARLVKERAKYLCEICGTPPFAKRSGMPFAEAHHIYELAVTRIDDPNQMLCVCPTCHRVIHYGNDESLKNRESLKP